MNIPSFTITHLIVDYLIKLEVSLNKINTTPLPRSHRKELRATLEIEDINQLSELINDPIGIYKAEQIQKGYIMPTRKSQYLIYTDYRSGLEFAKSYTVQTSIAPSTDLLLHINKIVFRKILEDWDTGKVRDFSDKPNEIYDTWAKHRDYYPNLNMTDYFNEVLKWVSDEKIATHRMIRFAVLLYELLDKAPLFAGNQVSSIVLMQALSREFGYNPDSMFSYAKALNFISDDLESAFKMSKSKRDLTVFIEAFLYTTSLQMLDLEEKIASTFDKKIKQGGKLRSKFNTRQIKILEYLENVDKITRDEYTKMMGLSFMTSYRDLKHLVEEEYLITKGSGRGTYYSLGDKIDNAKALEEKEIPVFGK